MAPRELVGSIEADSAAAANGVGQEQPQEATTTSSPVRAAEPNPAPVATASTSTSSPASKKGVGAVLKGLRSGEVAKIVDKMEETAEAPTASLRKTPEKAPKPEPEEKPPSPVKNVPEVTSGHALVPDGKGGFTTQQATVLKPSGGRLARAGFGV